MRLFRHYTEVPVEARGAVVALGNFDGLHRGHQAVIAAAAQKARQLGKRPLARVVSYATVGVDPKIMGMGPVPAVQRALERHPDVRGASVMGRADARLGAVPVAAVELRPGATTGAAALLEHAATLLAPYEIPVAIEVLKELPRTDSGKVDLVAMSQILGAPTAANP